jgi:leucyl-tRNA synthetase
MCAEWGHGGRNKLGTVGTPFMCMKEERTTMLINRHERDSLERIADTILREDRASKGQYNLQSRAKKRKSYAAELTKRSIPSEGWFITELRKSGIKLRGLMTLKQNHTVGNFIIDFAFPKLKIGIEVDGKIHDRTRNRDEARDGYLANRGWHIVRLNAYDMGNLVPLLNKIRKLRELIKNMKPKEVKRGQPLWDWIDASE